MTGVSPHRWPVRVYYEDTDFSGVVYHANYLRFLERGRTEYLRAASVDQAALFAQDMAFAVRRMTLDFRMAARMDDALMVETMVAALGGASVDMHQIIRRGDDVVMHAEVRIGLVAYGRVVRFPPWLRLALRPRTSDRQGFTFS